MSWAERGATTLVPVSPGMAGFLAPLPAPSPWPVHGTLGPGSRTVRGGGAVRWGRWRQVAIGGAAAAAVLAGSAGMAMGHSGRLIASGRPGAHGPAATGSDSGVPTAGHPLALSARRATPTAAARTSSSGLGPFRRAWVDVPVATV